MSDLNRHEDELKKIDKLIEAISAQIIPQVKSAKSAIENAFKILLGMELNAVYLETDLARVSPGKVNLAMAAINNRLTDIQFLQIRLTQHQVALREANSTLSNLIGVKKARLKTSDPTLRRQDLSLRADFALLHCVDEDGLLVEVKSTLDSLSEVIRMIVGKKGLLERTTQDAKYQHKMLTQGGMERLGQAGELQKADARDRKKEESDPLDALVDSFNPESDLKEDSTDDPSEVLGIEPLVPDAADDEVQFMPGEFQQGEVKRESSEFLSTTNPEDLPKLDSTPPEKFPEHDDQKQTETAEPPDSNLNKFEVSEAEVLRAIGINSTIIELGVNVEMVRSMLTKHGPCSIGKCSEYLGFKGHEKEEVVRDFIRYWCVERGIAEKEGSRSYKLGAKADEFDSVLKEAEIRVCETKAAVKRLDPDIQVPEKLSDDEFTDALFATDSDSPAELSAPENESEKLGPPEPLFDSKKTSSFEAANKDLLDWDKTEAQVASEEEKSLPTKQLEAKADEQVDPESILMGGNLPTDPAPDPKLASERDQEYKKHIEQPLDNKPEKSEKKEVVTEYSIDDLLSRFLSAKH